MQIVRIRLPYPKNGPKVTVIVRGLINILHLGNRGGDLFMWAVIDLDDFIAVNIHIWMFKETDHVPTGEYIEESLMHLETVQVRMYNMKAPYFIEKQSIIHMFIQESQRKWWAKFGGQNGEASCIQGQSEDGQEQEISGNENPVW